MRLEAGDQIDRYTLVARLGQGGQGEVWRAIDPLTPGRHLALKILDLSSASAVEMERARREAHALARLSHPVLLVCHALVEDLRHDALCLVLDLIEGQSLSELLDSAMPSPAQAQAIVQQLASGLAYLHREGLVHRDIKPDNVLITDLFWSSPTSPGALRLIDFGISVDRGNPRPLTAIGNLIGTPPFLAPERIDPGFWHAPDDTPAIDVFSLGVLGWLCLHGVHPAGLGLSESMPAFARAYRAIEQSEPVWPAVRRGDGIETVLRRCLSLRAADRPASGEDVVLLLDTFTGATSSPPPAPPLTSPSSSSRVSAASAPGPTSAPRLSAAGPLAAGGQPSYPAMPAVTGQPSYPPLPAVTGQPSYPPLPAVTGQPSYPPLPAVTGQPSFGAMPAVTGQPSYPSSPGVTGQPSYPAMPSSPVTLVDAPPRLPPTLIDVLPLTSAPPLLATAPAPPLMLALSPPAPVAPLAPPPALVTPQPAAIEAEPLRTRAIVARVLLVLIALVMVSAGGVALWRSTHPKPHHHQAGPLRPRHPAPEPSLLMTSRSA